MRVAAATGQCGRVDCEVAGCRPQANSQANSQAPRSLSGQGSQGPAGGRRARQIESPKSKRLDETGQPDQGGAPATRTFLLRLALRRFARLDKDCTDSAPDRGRKPVGWGSLAASPFAGMHSVISHLQISYQPALHDTSRAPSLAIGPVIVVLRPQYVRGRVFWNTMYVQQHFQISQAQLDEWRRGCVSHMEAPWKSQPDQTSVCLDGGSRWKNIHPVILHGSLSNTACVTTG